MISTNLIMTLSDIESLIQDWKARQIEEKEFKEEIRRLAEIISIDSMAEKIDRDLESGKEVMGMIKNPQTGEIEEAVKAGRKEGKKIINRIIDAFWRKQEFEREQDLAAETKYGDLTEENQAEEQE